jgi:hypothetical protein
MAYPGFGRIDGSVHYTFPSKIIKNIIFSLIPLLIQNEPLEYGQKICSAVGFWIRHFPIHFDANPQLCRLLERLKRLAAADESIPRPLVEELLDISAMYTYFLYTSVYDIK